MKAIEFMTKDVFTCKLEDNVEDAAKSMIERGISVIPIVDESNHLTGIVTESDFIGKEVSIPHALASIKQLFGQMFYFGDVETIYLQAKGRKLKEIMTRKVTTITPGESLSDVVKLMISKNLKRLPVVEDGNLVGIVTRRDIIKAFSLIAK